MSAATKKRKREEVEDNDQDKIVFSVLEHSTSVIGPVLASFPCIKPSHKTQFRAYVDKKAKTTGSMEDSEQKRLHIAGETDEVEFYSTSETDACRYYVGVRNKKTNKLTIRPSPMQVLARNVKALKNLAPAPSTTSERIEARNTLGVTFGTKKAQKAIRAAERNKVDVSAMEGVTGHLQASIEANTAALPTKEEARTAADNSRLIPPYNSQASTPSEAYALHDIVPEAEFNAVPITKLMSASTKEERLLKLPYKRSEWLQHHLDRAFAAPKPNKKTLKILMYISAMFSFRLAANKLCNDKEAMAQRLGGFPSNVVDGLLSRFTETMRGTTDVRVTSQNETTLLTYMFALCLHVDEFATDTSVVAKDLSMPVDKVNSLFKSLGCKVEKPTTTEIWRLGLPDSAAEGKRAILKVPLEFPKPKGKRRK